jgi:DNA-binding transcriptional ArsR family regulator
VRWEAEALRLDVPAIDYRIDVTGRGLCLMPCLFVRRMAVPISAGEPPSLDLSRTRHRDALGGRAADGPPVVALIGRRKAALLGCLGRPASTKDLAERLGITPGAVSQHLSVLHGAGLVTRARVGRVVLYARSELGTRLLAR